jgi:hypothetical protein
VVLNIELLAMADSGNVAHSLVDGAELGEEVSDEEILRAGC